MRMLSVLVMIVPLLSSTDAPASEPITIAGELARMRTTDHLFRSQSHRLLQYSGFHREGGNPDRYFCLYEEGGWRVVADHKGPGVVSRIWTTHDTSWRDIRIEVDGKTIFEGRADRFFSQDNLPFISPLSEIRNSVSGRVTAEKETPGRKEWAVSYVPIPFKKRLRYMQRDKLYANINIKAYSPDVEVESFLDADWMALKPEFDKTAAVWERMDLFRERQSACKLIAKSLTLPAAPNGTREISNLAELPGPGILRGIRVRTKEPQQTHNVELMIRWDDEEEFGIVAPLDHGFGSHNRRTLAVGQSVDGWRTLCLPMPFQEKASIVLASRSADVIPCDLELLVDDEAELPADVLYLRSCSNEGRIAKGAEFAKPDLPLADFFYHNGYTAFDHVGAGHIVAYMDLFDCQPELDEHVFIDDERIFPENSWNGTGHEDLFDMAWGHKPVSAPMTSGGSQDFEEVNVKLFWNDPMTFRKAIRFNWEWAFRFGVRPPRDARFASVVYWYGRPAHHHLAPSKETQDGLPSAAKATSTASVDLGPSFRERGLSTRAQGSRGTCSAFTVARAIEYAMNENQRDASRLSVEFLNWASNQAMGRQHDGGFFSDLWKGFEKYGICDEEEMPYASEFDPKRQPSDTALRQAGKRRDAGLQMVWIKPWDPTRGLTDEQFSSVKATLRQGWPVCGGFLWPKQAKWIDSVLQMASREGVRDGHSVLLIGYRDDPTQPGGGVFLIQNTSKGPRQGAMSYEFVRAYMNDAVWIGHNESSSSY